MGGKGGRECSLLENKQKRVAFCRGGGGRGCVWGQGRAGWEKSLEGVTLSEGSQPGQGGGDQCCVTLVGTVGSGSETAASACCHFLATGDSHVLSALRRCGGGAGTEVLATPKVVNTEARRESPSGCHPALKDLPLVSLGDEQAGSGG